MQFKIRTYASSFANRKINIKCEDVKDGQVGVSSRDPLIMYFVFFCFEKHVYTAMNTWGRNVFKFRIYPIFRISARLLYQKDSVPVSPE
jgi:hypothetical protein